MLNVAPPYFVSVCCALQASEVPLKSAGLLYAKGIKIKQLRSLFAGTLHLLYTLRTVLKCACATPTV
jgi:hypothetical protein